MNSHYLTYPVALLFMKCIEDEVNEKCYTAKEAAYLNFEKLDTPESPLPLDSSAGAGILYFHTRWN